MTPIPRSPRHSTHPCSRQVELARIKTELIIKDDYLIETLEILEVYFNVVLSRMGLIERQK